MDRLITRTARLHARQNGTPRCSNLQISKQYTPKNNI